MSLHRVFMQDSGALHIGAVVVTGEEARHAARVKRVEAGEPVEVLDGRGRVGRGRVKGSDKEGKKGEWRLHVEVERVEEAERVWPRVEVWSAAPKGPRMTDLIDGLSQVGAASWGWLRTGRGQEGWAGRGAGGDGKSERLERAAAEASKQSGRAWMLEIGDGAGLEEALDAGGGVGVVVADASGGRYAAMGRDVVRVLVGPEGGWTDEESARIRAAGVMVARFGPHTMRIETAAVAAAAVVLDVEQRARGEAG